MRAMTYSNLCLVAQLVYGSVFFLFSSHTKSVSVYGDFKPSLKVNNKRKSNSSTCTLLHSPLQTPEMEYVTGVTISC